MGAARGLEIVADDRVGRRRAAGLADGDADAREQQEEEGGRESRTAPPSRDQMAMHSASDDDAVEPVRDHGDRNAHQRIEDREGRVR